MQQNGAPRRPLQLHRQLTGCELRSSRPNGGEVSRAFVLSSPCRRNMRQRHNTFRAHSHRRKTEAWGDAPDKPNSLSTTSTNATVILPSRAANRYTIQQSRGQAKVGSANIRATGRKTAATPKNNTCACHTCMKLDLCAACRGNHPVRSTRSLWECLDGPLNPDASCRALADISWGKAQQQIQQPTVPASRIS